MVFASPSAPGTGVVGTATEDVLPEVLATEGGEVMSSGGLAGTKAFESQPGSTASAAMPRNKQGRCN